MMGILAGLEDANPSTLRRAGIRRHLSRAMVAAHLAPDARKRPHRRGRQRICAPPEAPPRAGAPLSGRGLNRRAMTGELALTAAAAVATLALRPGGAGGARSPGPR